MLFIVLLALLAVGYTTRRCYLHPLSRIPGPWLVALQPLWFILRLYYGAVYQGTQKLHETYGSIVRLGPSNLSFMSLTAHDLIYAARSGKSVTKSGTYQGLAFAHAESMILCDWEKKKCAKAASHVILDSLSLGPQEYLHDVHFRRLLTKLDMTVGTTTTANISALLDGVQWDILTHLLFGQDLPKRMREKKDIVNSLRPLASWACMLGECVFYLFGRTRVQNWVNSLALLAKKCGLEHFYFNICHDEESIQSDAAEPVKSSTAKASQEGDRVLWQHINPDVAALGTKTLNLSKSGLITNLTMIATVGSETTPMAVSAIVYLLLREPEHFHKLRQELHRSFTRLEDITDQKLRQLEYLNACIKESLRLLPPISGPIMQRVSKGTVIDGVYVPPDVAISVDLYALQRSALYWQNPEQFRPDRWLCQGTFDDHQAWRPFNIGSSSCPGRKLALQALRLTVAKLLFLFHMELSDKSFVWERDTKSILLWEHSMKVELSYRPPEATAL